MIDHEQTREIISSIRKNVARVIVGKQDTLDLILIALISRGHVLIEDVPGIGKTTLVSTIARTLGLTFHRIQFTPDVMPSDITGFNLYNQKTGQFEYHPGSIMSQLILADEINRTSPKTQSSLLEAMQENQVTVDGTTYPVPQPFMVLATQNPVEHVGTFPLPEAQLDRFMLKVSLGYPSIEEEMTIYSRFSTESPLEKLDKAVTVNELEILMLSAQDVHCSDAVRRYVAMIAQATRQHPDLTLGASPRASLMLLLAAKGKALLSVRDYVTPDDVREMAGPVLVHRLLQNPESRLRGHKAQHILQNLLQIVPVPIT